MKNIFHNTKRRSIVLVCALALGGLNACDESFLDVEPQGQAVSEDFFVTQEHAIEAVNSFYGNLREWNNIAFAFLAITTISSDNAEKGSAATDAVFMNNFDNFSLTATEGQLNGYWVGQYQGINLVNQVLTNVPEIEMDESLKARLLAEAKFFRAYHYFNLVRAFGGVPIVSKLPETPEELNPARASREEVYDFIIQDLREAAEVLPVRYDAANVGRATKGAALTLLAKVQLYQENWAEVLSLTEQVMSMGYMLTPEYADIFTIAGENNAESIFEIQVQSIPGNCAAGSSQWGEVQGVRGQYGWGFVEPTQDLVEAFEEGDERMDATILFRGEVTPAGDSVLASAPNPRYNQKAYAPARLNVDCGSGSNQNIRILRFAEVLLMHAEAANELGQTEEALETLNMVRMRAGLEPIESATQEELRNIIWHERRVELALENGDRFFDLVRQGRADEVLRAHGKAFKAGINEVMPIPQQQITLSGGTLTQNPGY
ncbi:RagB/SusD family nutrient uptake outer membrane protein [Pontibacter toksunensis]|uniref:RagB/SusD family nutrient uptake outer membrane protein n=1 Tax=Pontibacter toksunensis TaxID=1332631 RepID=A0ABW6BRS1_9BACT